MGETPGGFNYTFRNILSLAPGYEFPSEVRQSIPSADPVCGYNHIGCAGEIPTSSLSGPFFCWDDPQLTSVTELSEQKLPLVTPPTCTVISALIVSEKPLAGVTVRSPKVHRLSLSVQCAFTECRATNRQPAQDTGGREGGTEQTPGANIKCERGQDSWGCWGADGEVINTSGPGQHTGVDYRLKVRGKDIVTLCDDTVWHVCRVCWLWE